MADIHYDVDALPTEDGQVHVTISMMDKIDGVSKSVDLGTHTDHQAAAQAATAWIVTDLGVFADIGGERSKA